jgi:hypothetical protein
MGKCDSNGKAGSAEKAWCTEIGMESEIGFASGRDGFVVLLAEMEEPLVLNSGARSGVLSSADIEWPESFFLSSMTLADRSFSTFT